MTEANKSSKHSAADDDYDTDPIEAKRPSPKADSFSEWAMNARTISLLRVAEIYKARLKRFREALRDIANAGEIHDPHWAGRIARVALEALPPDETGARQCYLCEGRGKMPSAMGPLGGVFDCTACGGTGEQR